MSILFSCVCVFVCGFVMIASPVFENFPVLLDLICFLSGQCLGLPEREVKERGSDLPQERDRKALAVLSGQARLKSTEVHSRHGTRTFAAFASCLK